MPSPLSKPMGFMNKCYEQKKKRKKKNIKYCWIYRLIFFSNYFFTKLRTGSLFFSFFVTVFFKGIVYLEESINIKEDVI